MKEYQLNIPTKIYYGRDIWKDALKQSESLLQGTVMIVTTGRTLIRLGYLARLQEQTEAFEKVKKVIIFDEISANPRLSEVRRGICLGKTEGVESIIGFGGGSAMDAAKAIAAGIGMVEDIGDCFDQGREPGKGTLPVIAIPTTAGTGSELSKAAIITDEQRQVKGGIRGKALYPQIAIVDSLFTESVPFSVTMETGFDVLAHAIESYVSKASSPYTRMLSEYAVQITGKYLPVLAENLQDGEAREKMSFASMLMGINLGNASTCLPHRLQYPLGAHTDTSHGAGLAALFPAWIGCVYPWASAEIEKLLGLLSGRQVRGKEACQQVIYRFIRRLKLPASLQELGVDRAELAVMASEVTGNIQNDPSAGGPHIIRDLYESAWQKKKMQAIIMAAGKGSRLGSLTGGNPKSFAEIRGKKLIEYNLRLLEKYGIDEIFIVTGYRSEAFAELTKDMPHVQLVYNPFYEMVNVLGSFYMGMESLSEDFIYLHADTLCEPSVFEKLLCMDADVTLPVAYGKCDEEAMKVRSEDGRIVQITKQMPPEAADGEFIGMASFRKEVIPALQEKTRQLMEEKEFTAYFESAVQRLLDEEAFEVKAVSTDGAFWAEIDFMEDYERAVASMPESLTTIFE